MNRGCPKPSPKLVVTHAQDPEGPGAARPVSGEATPPAGSVGEARLHGAEASPVVDLAVEGVAPPVLGLPRPTHPMEAGKRVYMDWPEAVVPSKLGKIEIAITNAEHIHASMGKADGIRHGKQDELRVGQSAYTVSAHFDRSPKGVWLPSQEPGCVFISKASSFAANDAPPTHRAKIIDAMTSAINEFMGESHEVRWLAQLSDANNQVRQLDEQIAKMERTLRGLRDTRNVQLAKECGALIQLGFEVPKAPVAAEVTKNFNLSTAHIMRHDSELLESTSAIITYGYPGGCFVYVGYDADTWPDTCEGVLDAGFSMGFVAACEAARAGGCKFLQLDADAGTVDGLNQYEW